MMILQCLCHRHRHVWCYDGVCAADCVRATGAGPGGDGGGLEGEGFAMFALVEGEDFLRDSDDLLVLRDFEAFGVF